MSHDLTLLPDSILSRRAWFPFKAKPQSLLERKRVSWENTGKSCSCSWRFPATMIQAGSSVTFLLMVSVWRRPRVTSAEHSTKANLALFTVSTKVGLGRTLGFSPVLLLHPFWRFTFLPELREASSGCKALLINW
jgi:hypothetical protein